MAGNDRSGIKRYVVVSPLKVQVAKDFAAGFVDDVNSDIVKTADGLAIAGGRAASMVPKLSTLFLGSDPLVPVFSKKIAEPDPFLINP
jgi:hypothetical protein